MGELGLGLELLLGDAQATLDLLEIVGAASDEPGAERGERGRRNEHLDGLGHRCANLARALDLDLEHDGHAGANAVLELGAQRAVTPAGVVGVLDEVAELRRGARTPRR